MQRDRGAYYRDCIQKMRAARTAEAILNICPYEWGLEGDGKVSILTKFVSAPHLQAYALQELAQRAGGDQEERSNATARRAPPPQAVRQAARQQLSTRYLQQYAQRYPRQYAQWYAQVMQRRQRR